MSLFNIKPMSDDEENQTIPPTATSDNDFQDIISNDQPATTVTPTTPTPVATPAPKQKPALSEFEQYKQMYPDDAIQKYVESFRPNPSDDRSARFAKYAKLNAIGQGLTAIANLVGASHGAKIYAPQQNNTTQQLIGAAEQEKAKQEAKEEKYNLMKYQSALNTLNNYRTYQAALAKQAFDAEQNQKKLDNAKEIAEGNNATSEKVAGLNNATKVKTTTETIKAENQRNANNINAENQRNKQNNDAKLNQAWMEYRWKGDHPMVIDGKEVIVPAALYNTTLGNISSTILPEDQMNTGYPAILKNKVYNQIAKDYTVDKNGTLVPKKVVTPMQKAVAASPTAHYKLGKYKIVRSSDPNAVGTVIPEADLYGKYTHEQLEQAIKAGNIQKVN